MRYLVLLKAVTTPDRSAAARTDGGDHDSSARTPRTPACCWTPRACAERGRRPRQPARRSPERGRRPVHRVQGAHQLRGVRGPVEGGGGGVDEPVPEDAPRPVARLGGRGRRPARSSAPRTSRRRRSRSRRTSRSTAAVEAVWRIESGRLVAGLARITGDVGPGRGARPGRAGSARCEQWPAERHPRAPRRLADGHREAPARSTPTGGG